VTTRMAVAKRASSLSIWTIAVVGSAVAAPKQQQQVAYAQQNTQMNYYTAPAPTERLAAGASVQHDGHSYANNATQATPNYYAPATHTSHAAQYNYYPVNTSAAQPQSSRKSLKSFFKNASAANHYQQQQPTTQNVSYQPASGTEAVGKASWYGSDFHGGKTANGERYNMESLTAAHRTLPFGSQVKVTCLDTGKECVVRINNRGPYIKGRILDLSKAAARQVGMLGRGVGRIKMQVLSYGG
jgi:rare lipoprotein A